MKRLLVIMTVAGLAMITYSITRTEEAPAPARVERAAAVQNRVHIPQFTATRGVPSPLPIAEAVRAAPDADPVGRVEPSRSKPAPSLAEAQARFASFFESEPVDSSWSWKAMDSLTKGVQAVLPAGSTLRRLDCRGTLCRIETEHADLAAFRTFVQNAFLTTATRLGNSGFFSSLVGDSKADGPLTAVAYLAREGKQLPDPDVLFATQ